MTNTYKTVKIGILATITLALVALVIQTNSAKATCAPPPTDKGVATTVLDIPSPGSYRVWSRIKAPNSTVNSYNLEIDGTTCGIIVGDKAITAGAWTWVDYQSGSDTNKINVNLTAGPHTLKIIGREAGLKVDRVILTADPDCFPSGDGGNCVTFEDSTKPTTTITSPANGATISNTVSVEASASDNEVVSRVEFYLDDVKFAEDTSVPYTTDLNSKAKPNGTHTFQTKAYDVTGNVGLSTKFTVTFDNDALPPDVTLTAPTAGTVSGKIPVSANATDNKGVAQVEFFVISATSTSGKKFSVGADSTSPYSLNMDTSKSANGDVIVEAVATDLSGNTDSSVTTVTFNNTPADTTKPTAPTSLVTTTVAHDKVNLSWGASSDALGVVKYGVYRDNSLLAYVTHGTTYSDTTVSASKTYSYYVKAFDAADNVSDASNAINVSTPEAPDTTDPTVTLTSPTAGNVSGRVVLSANADDNKGVASVTFYANNYLIGKDTEAPFSIFMDSTRAPNSTIDIVAVATDTSGRTKTSSPVIVTINNVPPDILPPLAPTGLVALALKNNQINLSWKAATDNVGVVKYEINRNYVKIATVSGTTTTYGDSNLQAGKKYFYGIVAVDAAGNRSPQSNVASATAIGVK